MAKHSIDPKTLAEKRTESKNRLLEIVSQAYDARLVSKNHQHGDVVYTVRIPHEHLEKYCLVADHDV